MKEASTHTGTEKGEFTAKEKVIYSLVGIVILGSAFFIGRSLVRKAVSTSEERKSYDDNNPAAFAKRMRQAFDNDGWWGTNEEALRETIKAVPSKTAFKEVIKSYQKLYNGSLMKDMQDELQTSEYNEMIAIIATKPDKYVPGQLPAISGQQFLSWAKRLKAAFDLSYGWIPATDEAAIKTVFIEIPTQLAFQQVATVYKNEYGNDLLSDLKGELELWEYGPMLNIINKKPKA
jgi:hypothetical protein